MASPGPSSSARASAVPRCFLLNRAPRFTYLHAAGADVVVELVKPPAISTAFVDASLSPTPPRTLTTLLGVERSGYSQDRTLVRDAVWETAPLRNEGHRTLLRDAIGDSAPLRIEGHSTLLRDAIGDSAPLRIEGHSTLLRDAIGDSAAFRNDGDRTLIPDAARDTAPCRVEGADASGCLLLSFPSPRAPGESHLLACRLVASGSGDAANATGKAFPIRAFPESPGLALSSAAPTGILSDLGGESGEGFLLAQMAPSSASVARMLCYSSDNDSWSVEEVRGEESWRDFAADRVVSHDRGVRGDAARLVFVDLNRGLLLFHPRVPGATRFVRLPHGVGGGNTTVDSSDGKLVCVAFVDAAEPEGSPFVDAAEGSKTVRFWSLCEENLQWIPYADQVAPDELHQFDPLLPLLPVRAIGPVDPRYFNRVFFIVDTKCFSVNVEVKGEMFERVRLIDITDCDASESPLVCPLHHDAKSWLDGAKEVGQVVINLVQSSRKHIDKLPDTVQHIGDALNIPFTPALVTSAKVAKKVNDTVTAAEKYCKKRAGAPPGPPTEVVGDMNEARQALQIWIGHNRRRDMMVDPAHGMPEEEWRQICAFFIKNGAYTLIQHLDWEMM